MAKFAAARDRALIDFPFHAIRNITSPEDAKAGRKVYSGTAPASSIIGLPNDENVRDYIVAAPAKKRRTMTAVHRAMFATLTDAPDTFCVKNGGCVIVARALDVDEHKHTARLRMASLINGAQTQGVLADYLEMKAKEEAARKAAASDVASIDQSDERGREWTPAFPVSVKYEIVVADDDDLIGEISIARNSQNNVDPLSIAGKRGVLEDLQASMLRVNPAWQIRQSETDGGEDFIDTPKLLQVTMALIPPSIWPVKKDADNPNKVFTYSMRAKCLKDFQKYFAESSDPTAKDSTISKEVYDFIVEMAPRAWTLYQKWKTHQGFIGTNIQQGVTRDEHRRKVLDVADGIIFPVLAALAVFVEKTESGWAVVTHPLFEDKDVIDALKLALKSPSINGNPWNLGKSRDAYTQLFNVTNGTRRMAEKLNRALHASPPSLTASH